VRVVVFHDPVAVGEGDAFDAAGEGPKRLAVVAADEDQVLLS
jgi:hypothetical protein